MRVSLTEYCIIIIIIIIIIAEAAADRKTSKYSQLAQTYIFVPIAMETLGPMNSF